MQIPSDTHFIYVHGFNSSPKSFKAQQVLECFRQSGAASQLSVPELSHFPSDAIEQLKSLVEGSDKVLLIGSSLGGFYSTWLTEHYANACAVLVNPAVAPHRLLSAMLGETENFYTGQRYQLTHQHMAQLEALFLQQTTHPERLLLLQQQGDETLDYRDAVGYYKTSRQIVQPGGSHAFDGFDSMLPLIMDFATGTLDPELLTHAPQV